MNSGNQDKAEGTVKKAMGNVKEKVGQAIGNPDIRDRRHSGLTAVVRESYAVYFQKMCNRCVPESVILCQAYETQTHDT
jgi:hypothetical protein